MSFLNDCFLVGVYPGAPGTSEGIDNNCNGTVEDDENDTCPPDLNGDGMVNTADLLLLIGNFGCNDNCLGDIDGDDSTNTSDLLILLGHFGIPCP